MDLPTLTTEGHTSLRGVRRHLALRSIAEVGESRVWRVRGLSAGPADG